MKGKIIAICKYGNSHLILISNLTLQELVDEKLLCVLKVRNRRSRRWLNDRLLMELVPRLNAEEIRGLFAPPPWGKYVSYCEECNNALRMEFVSCFHSPIGASFMRLP